MIEYPAGSGKLFIGTFKFKSVLPIVPENGCEVWERYTMKNKKILGTIVATFFATFLLLSIPNVSAVQYTTIKDSVKQIPLSERIEICKKILQSKLKDKAADGIIATLVNYLAWLIASFLFGLFLFFCRDIWGIRPF